MDVARCLADANLVSGDLIHVLAAWKENATQDRYKARIALACYEILAPLTWPIEKNKETMTNNHHRHVPVLELAQLRYKRDIINFDNARLLHTAVRTALPSMAVPIGDRTQRDSAIIKLVLYFLRNIAMIALPPGLKFDGDESQISRAATIDAFSYQDIFLTLLTLASNMGEDFKMEDMIVMEIIFHIIKRVDIKKLFLDENELRKAKNDELADAMKKEASMLRSYTRKAPTRHSRFGTMVWVQKADGKVSSLSGHGALADVTTRERKMDESKTFRPPRRAAKEEMEPKDLGPPVILNARANKQLRDFVEDFLDSGFNPLFSSVRKTLEREGVEVLQHHAQQYFYTVAWFLEAERARQQSNKGPKPSSQEQVSSFQLVASVLNQETFILLKRHLEKAYTASDWRELNATMRCFTQVLLTIQEMFASENEEDQEIAENALSRLFYEEATHDAIVNIARSYKDQGFDYLDACTELVHTYMRVLEAYSKENVDMQVRSKKRTRKKKKANQAAPATEEADGEDRANDDDDDDSENDQASAEKTSQERKFDFKKFANRFVPQGVVDTFFKFTKYYRDLNEIQLKRAHRYFYRLAFKQDMSVMLFRVDMIHLFFNMIKGPEPLDKSLGMYKEWEEIVKQLIRRCVKKIEERPALLIELLFSKINATAYYLEYGYDRQVVSTSTPRRVADLDFKRVDLTLAEQIGIAVSLLINKNESDLVAWVKSQLESCEGDRKFCEGVLDLDESATGKVVMGQQAEPPVFSTWSHFDQLCALSFANQKIAIDSPDDDARKNAMFKNPRLQLLLRAVGCERLSSSIPESPWIIPPRHSAEDLAEYRELINKAEFAPPLFDDGKTAEQQVRRKTAPRKKAAYDDADDEDVDDLFDDGEGELFPKNLPSKKLVGPDSDRRPKKRRVRRRKDRSGSGSEGNALLSDDDEEEAADERRTEKARKRRKRELEKQRKIKSTLYVDSEDDKSDAERDAAFFAREEAIRQRVKKALAFAPMDASELLLQQQQEQPSAAGLEATLKRLMAGSDAEEEDASSSHDGEQEPGSSSLPPSRKRKVFGSDSDEEGEETSPQPAKKAATASTSRPITITTTTTSNNKKKKKSKLGFLVDTSDEEDENEDVSMHDDEDGDEDDDMATNDTPLSSNPKNAGAADPDGDDDDDDVPVVGKRRPRIRAGFMYDSDDE